MSEKLVALVVKDNCTKRDIQNERCPIPMLPARRKKEKERIPTNHAKDENNKTWGTNACDAME